MRIGNTDIQITAGRASDWLSLLVFGSKLAAASAILGVIIGFVFRKHLFGQVIVSIVVSIAFFAVLEWRWGEPGEWSWRDPITSAAYLVAPAALFICAPTLFAALLVGRLCIRRKTS